MLQKFRPVATALQLRGAEIDGAWYAQAVTAIAVTLAVLVVAAVAVLMAVA